MNEIKRTTIKLPEISTIKISDSITVTKIYKKIIKRLLLENIKDFIDIKDLNYLISKINKIEINPNINQYIGNTIFEDGILYLPPEFFTIEINKTSDVLNLFNEYPALKDILTTYGIYVINYNKKDSNEDKTIKNLIATHFATRKESEFPDTIITGQMTFNGYATTNALLENIIRELSLIIGEKKLYETLKKDTSILIEEIDKKTNKPGLGKKLIDDILKLSYYSNKEKYAFAYNEQLENIINKKLIPIYELIKKYDIETQRSILNIIKFKNYDFNILKEIDNTIDISNIEPLTNIEKQYINTYIKVFDNLWNEYRYLVVGYPKETPNIDKTYNGKTFSFLNKIFSSHEQIFVDYLNICINMQETWNTIQETILWELIPRYIKYNKKAYIDLEEILLLSKYNTDKIKYNLSTSKKTKSIEKKLIKNK